MKSYRQYFNDSWGCKPTADCAYAIEKENKRNMYFFNHKLEYDDPLYFHGRPSRIMTL